MTLTIKVSKAKCKEVGGTLACETKMEDSPSHQDYVADKKPDLEIVKDDEAKPDTWD